MKSSHIALICIVMISLFALHECKRSFLISINVYFVLNFSVDKVLVCVSNQCVGRDAGTVSKIARPSCIHTECTLYSLHQDCWCCNKLIDGYKSVCWREKDTPSAKDLCFAFCPKWM